MNYEIKSISETVSLIKQNNASMVRFGDGEFDILNGKSIPYQDFDTNLSNQLTEILHLQSSQKFVVGIPDVFTRLERYNTFAQQFWKGKRPEFEHLLTSKWYVTTFVSRPYIDLENKSEAAESFKQIISLWQDKDILIVEGETSRSGVGNDLFSNARSLSRIICPSHNAYEKSEEILSTIKRHGQDKLILIMLGPTAKVLTYQLYKEGYQSLDIGHIDSEYEWFKMGATSKVKLRNKHTAEYNFDEDIVFLEDQEYLESIIDRVT